MKGDLKTLAYWKGRLQDVRQYIRELRKAERYAQRRIEMLERQRLGLRTWLWLVVAVYICAFMAGCHTLRGLGRDVEAITAPYTQNR